MKKEFRKKNKARKLAVQVLYSNLLITNNINNFDENTMYFQNKNKVDMKYFLLLIKNIYKRSLIFDTIISKNLSANTQITLIESIIVKIAFFEIFFNTNLHFKIIINESIILANMFCSKKSYMLINKTLNNIIKSYGLFKLIS